MLILSLDATALSASVAICRDETLVAEFTVCTGHTHSETLLPMVESCLKTASLTVDDVDLFACTTGPGSFTGVRIGAATIKGLSFGRNKPCIGVSTLESLSENGSFMNGILCPVMNARRSQVYNALFASDGQGMVCRLCPDRALSIENLGQELMGTKSHVYLMGDGAYMVMDALAPLFGEQMSLLPERLLLQSGYNTALCAKRLYDSGIRTTDVEMNPVYLRPSQAERALKAKQEAEKKAKPETAEPSQPELTADG